MDPRVSAPARAFGIALALVPALGWACPACASRGVANGAVAWAIAAMIASPLVVGAVVLGVARRLQRGP